MIAAINYANEKYRKQQRLNSKTARWFGKVDKVYSFSPEDIDSDFREANKDILSHPRGNALWLWKPYFINKVMRELNDGDVICYADSGKFPYQYLSANRLFRINKREKPYQLEHIYMLLPRKANPYIYFAKICIKMVLKKNLIIRK
jgi:hypothetical protein